MKEPGLIEQQRDDDEGDEGEGRIPDDVPDDRDVARLDDPGGERQGGPGQGAPPDPDPLRLPNHEYQGDKEDGERKHPGRFS